MDTVIHLLSKCRQATKGCTSFYKLRAPNTAPFHVRLQRPPDLTRTSKNWRGILTLHEWLIYRAGPPAIVASITASESILNMYTPRFYNKEKRKTGQYFHLKFPCGQLLNTSFVQCEAVDTPPSTDHKNPIVLTRWSYLKGFQERK